MSSKKEIIDFINGYIAINRIKKKDICKGINIYGTTLTNILKNKYENTLYLFKIIDFLNLEVNIKKK